MRTIATIEGEKITELNDGAVCFNGRGRIDDDGTGPAHGDSYHQKDTSLHHNGIPLNADFDKYVVVPPQIIKGVKGIVLGCQAFVTNTTNGKRSEAVVGDIGPRARLGEISRALAEALGIDPNPNTGGMDQPKIFYRIRPGIVGVVDGKRYQLQAS